MAEVPLAGLQVADTVAVHLGLALVVGSVASLMWLRSARSAWRDQVARQAVSAARLGFALTLAALPVALWLEAALATETPLLDAASATASLLQHTHFGHAWMAGLLAWLAAGLFLAGANAGSVASHPGRLAAGLLSLVIFAAARSVVSHAASHGDATPDVALDGLHIVLASLWVGIVLAGMRIALPGDAAPATERGDATRWVSRLSATATAALAGIVATGLFNAWRSVAAAASLGEFLASGYGQVLAVKLVLVAIAAGLGGFNRFRVLPPLFATLDTARAPAPADWRRRLVAILRVEAATLLLVLVAAAVLGSTEPPGA
jgi:putative copper resistance protein D